jgi:hypothetical protein
MGQLASFLDQPNTFFVPAFWAVRTPVIFSLYGGFMVVLKIVWAGGFMVVLKIVWADLTPFSLGAQRSAGTTRS